MAMRMQKVERYESVVIAKYDMIDHIIDGWFVHTCATSSHDVLVVYEKEEQDA